MERWSFRVVVASVVAALAVVAPAATSVAQTFPEQVGGFRFGMPIREAARACRRAGHHWATEPLGDGATFTCSGVVQSIGYPATVLVNVCDGEVCAVGLAIDLDSPVATGRAFEDLDRDLRQRYGAPYTSHAEAFGVSQDLCDHDERTRGYDMVAIGRCQLVRTWEARNGSGIRLALLGEDARLSVMLVCATQSARTRGSERAL